VVEALISLGKWSVFDLVYEAEYRTAWRIVASPGKDVSDVRKSITESWVPIWLPRSRQDRTPCPVFLDSEAGRYNPPACGQYGDRRDPESSL
jgi:hypothetical protein